MILADLTGSPASLSLVFPFSFPGKTHPEISISARPRAVSVLIRRTMKDRAKRTRTGKIWKLVVTSKLQNTDDQSTLVRVFAE